MTAFRASLEQAVYEREYTKAILNTVSRPVGGFGRRAARAIRQSLVLCMFGHFARENAGRSAPRTWRRPVESIRLWGSLEEIFSDNLDFGPTEIERALPALGPRTLLLDAHRVSRAGDAMVLLAFHDITERKQAENARARLAAIVESSEDAIVGIDLIGTITSWNHGAERLFGYTSEEAIGQSVYMLIPADRLEEERSILGRIGRGDHVDHFETVRRRKDGALSDISLTVSPIGDARGLIVGASKTARDISGRKRAEAALQESERRFREMVDALPVAVYTTDAQGRLTHFNPAAVEFAGRTPELGRDRWCVTWKIYRADGTPMPHDEAPMALALKEMRPIRGTQAIAERPNGERRWFEPYPTPLFDAAGRLSGAINMLIDVTEQKRAQEALRDADRRKDEFLALLAHELRNPLAPILVSIEIMRRAKRTEASDQELST